MKIFTKSVAISFLLLILFSFNAFAMTNNYEEPIAHNPQNEVRYDDPALNYRWTWVNDEKCLRFNFQRNSMTREDIYNRWEIGQISQWAYKDEEDNKYKLKTRDTYSGTWSTSTDGIKSFTFDDCTIPVGVTKIDGILYAFDSFGELKEGYEYYTGFKTGADGLVVADTDEFKQWLSEQYLPECTSHEEDSNDSTATAKPKSPGEAIEQKKASSEAN